MVPASDSIAAAGSRPLAGTRVLDFSTRAPAWAAARQ